MELVLNNQRINLETVRFDRISPVRTENAYNVVVEDNVRDIFVGNGMVEFKYIRNVKLEPNSLFIICVTFTYKAIFDESLPKDRVEKTIQKEIDSIINRTTMPAVASQIIANLTAINGGAPLIVNPTFVRTNKEEDQ